MSIEFIFILGLKVTFPDQQLKFPIFWTDIQHSSRKTGIIAKYIVFRNTKHIVFLYKNESQIYTCAKSGLVVGVAMKHEKFRLGVKSPVDACLQLT